MDTYNRACVFYSISELNTSETKVANLAKWEELTFWLAVQLLKTTKTQIYSAWLAPLASIINTITNTKKRGQVCIPWNRNNWHLLWIKVPHINCRQQQPQPSAIKHKLKVNYYHVHVITVSQDSCSEARVRGRYLNTKSGRCFQTGTWHKKHKTRRIMLVIGLQDELWTWFTQNLLTS